MMRRVRSRQLAALSLPLLLLAVSGCDIVTAEYGSRESAEWRKSYDLQPGGRVEIRNVNGKIDVEPSNGRTLEVIAVKTAKAGSPEAAKEALERIEIAEQASDGSVRIETRLPRSSGLFRGGSGEVHYTVRMPASTDSAFHTVNGGIEVAGLNGRLELETTNGGIKAHDVGGAVQASTTNGGIEVDVTRVTDDGVSLSCTNGGIRLRVPPDAKATISASVTNGGINAEGLSLETTQSSRRRLEARLNGGGPQIKIEGTNGGIRISGR